MEFERTIDPHNLESTRILFINPEELKPFPNQPFKLYEGENLRDLICSIQESGVHDPIRVRRISDGNYEILAGHNRVHAAKEAGLDKVPCIVCKPKSEEEAQKIVVEDNLLQRSMERMKPSELANALYMLNEAMKKQSGYRADLQDPKDGSQSENRLRTMHIIGDKYGLSQATIARYIRAAKLSKGLQECLDNKLIGLGVAEHLSYLRSNEQDIAQKLLEEKFRIGIQQAKELKIQSLDHELDESEIKQIIQPKVPAAKMKSVRLREDLFAKYFTEDQTPEEIESTIEKALALLQSQSQP